MGLKYAVAPVEFGGRVFTAAEWNALVERARQCWGLDPEEVAREDLATWWKLDDMGDLEPLYYPERAAHA